MMLLLTINFIIRYILSYFMLNVEFDWYDIFLMNFMFRFGYSISRLSNVLTYVMTLNSNKKSHKQHNKWHWMQYMTFIFEKLNPEKCFKLFKKPRNAKKRKWEFLIQNHQMCAFWGIRIGNFRKMQKFAPKLWEMH